MTASADDRNREVWTVVNAAHTDAAADAEWRSDEIVWGLFKIPDAELGALGPVAGLDVVELGCGTAYFSARLGRAGARPIGVDLTPAQLRTARRCQELIGPSFPLIEASAERVPLPDDCADLVVSEYGASAWCDPELWIGEAARLLRPGGRLVFLTNSVLVSLCVPEAGGMALRDLQRPQRGMGRVAWPGGGIEYHPAHSDWIRILTSSGFTVQSLTELYPPEGRAHPEYYEIVDAAWARDWPAEDLWVAALG